MHLRLSLAALALAVLSPALHALEAGVARPAGHRSDRILIRASKGADEGKLQALHRALGSGVLRKVAAAGGTEVIKLPPGLDVAKALERFRASGAVEFAEPDYLVQPLLAPNDFHYVNQDQWNLHNQGIYGGTPGADIMAEAAWDLRTDASNIIVAVIDSGVRYTHEDLAANMWVNPGESGTDAQGRDKRTNGVDDDANGYVDDVHGMNVLNGSGNPWDDWGHGTHVAGIVGAVGNNGLGVAGVAWRVKIMACKFITGAGQYSVSDAITCLDYARVKGAKIVTASWGGYAFQSQALRDALTALRNAGILVAAAAGNDNSNNDTMPLYPASYDLDNIVAVAATDRTDNRAGWSNYGAASVDLGAPGAPVFSTFADSDRAYRYYDGTSMAAPHVAGAAALIWARFPADTHQQVIQRMISTADPLPSLAGRTRSGGRLNLAAALGSSAPPPPAPAPAAPTALGGSASSATVVNLTWTDNANNETGFEIERSTDNVTFVASGTAAANATSATVTGLTGGTTYRFRIRAVHATAASAYSNIATVATPTAPPPPAGSWQNTDIGAVAAAGSAAESGGTLTLRGSGSDIWDNADEFHFRYQTLNGDGQIVARVTGLTNTNSWAKAGVMMRETLATGSRHAFMCVTVAQGTAFQRRTETNGASASTSGFAGSALPKWLRLTRAGNTFTAEESSNGTSWTQVGTATLAVGASLQVGLAITSHNDGTLGTATFDNVSVTGGSTPPPPPPPPAVATPTNLAATAVSAAQINLSWIDNATNETGYQVERSTDQSTFTLITTLGSGATAFADTGRAAATTYYYRVRAVAGTTNSAYSNNASATTGSVAPPPGTWSQADVGAVGVAGSNESSGNTMTVRGSGADIWDSADAFRFVYRTLTSDCTVEARVSSLTNTNGWAKAGVMIRESLAPNARNVFALVTAASGVGAQTRQVTGGGTTFTGGPWGAAAPYWVRLVRLGGNVAAYVSANGTAWTLLGNYAFPSGGTIYVGFAVTSHDNAQLGTAVFSDPFIQ
jgi:subtilisin family serine protease/regulation of enolase protein 1 (concanavalin A-like superfamily)